MKNYLIYTLVLISFALMSFTSESDSITSSNIDQQHQVSQLNKMNFVRGSCVAKIDGFDVLVSVSCFLCDQTRANQRACRKAKELEDTSTIRRDFE